MNDRNLLDRRQLLRGAAGVGVGVGLAASGAMLGGPVAAAAPRTIRKAAKRPACVLARQQSEGPYYLDADLVRSDVTERRAGMPLALAITVVDVAGCRAIRDAAVDIWHCDAEGAYSGVDGDPSTFMRGTQMTNAAGTATFATVYPGWYPGRAVHIHVKVHVGGTDLHTGQLYFDEKYTDRVYATAPYSARRRGRTTNAQDGIFDGANPSILALKAAGGGTTGAITLGLRP